MKSYLIVLVILINIVIGCKNPEHKGLNDSKGYLIKGKIKNCKTKKVFLVKVPFDSSENIVDSILSDVKGRFTFEGKLNFPALYLIRTEINDQALYFILENSSIDVIGDARLLPSARIIGSLEQKIKEVYDSVNHRSTLTNGFKALDIQLKNTKYYGDSIALKNISKRYAELRNAKQAKIDTLMKKYPLAVASVNQLTELIYNRELGLVDSLLKRYEASPIAKSSQVRYFRKQLSLLMNLSIGKKAPSFNLVDTSGRPIYLSTFRGKYVLLDFWASWCLPCRMSNPVIRQISNKYKNKNLEVISLSIDINKTGWLKAIHEDHLLWTQVWDPGGKVAEQYLVSYIPYNYLLDPKGIIVATNIKESEMDNQLKRILVD